MTALAMVSGLFALASVTATHAAGVEDIKPILEGSEKYSEAYKAYEAEVEAGKEDAVEPDFADFVSGEPDALWGSITEAAGDEENGDAVKEALDGLSDKAQEGIYANIWTPSGGFTAFIVNNLWILLAAALVFLMHLGFATLESGLCQSKNTVNVLFKNCWIIAIGLVTYYFWGFNAHYPGADAENWVIADVLAFGKTANISGILTGGTNIYHSSYTWWTDFIFQGMFAATAATIVSGAVAERVKLVGFMVFAVLLVGFAYPLVGSWKWGTGFLDDMGFYDFAGSSMVHGFGGFAALACVLVLGPRLGKYTKNGTKPILGHSMPLATIGVFLLFLGWFGFNGGSVLAAEPFLVSTVFVTTALAAVAGAIGSIFTAWIVLKKPDLSMALNGFLAGLVGITAGADIISPTMSLVVGLVAGIVVVFSIVGLDKLKIDDPVGAVSVHGVCGVLGTLACALGGKSFGTQLIGALSVCAAGFIFSFVVFYVIKLTLGVRVPEEMEIEGLDIEEHGSPAYGDMAAQQ